VNLWDFLDRAGERRARLASARPINARLLANVIGCALISGFLGSLIALFCIPIPDANKDLITYMLGQLSGFAGGIVAYHYTLSASQREQEARQSALDVKRADNTGKLADAVVAAATGVAPTLQGDAGMPKGET
jgi:hypothetical protein